MNLPDVITQLQEKFPGAIGLTTLFRGETSIAVQREKIVEVCRYLKTSCGFDMLTDLSGVDFYGEEPRYEVDYLLYSMTDLIHLRLKARVAESSMEIDSVTSVWQTANWHEREAFDMFGLRFKGHPNLKRILMWEGYPHHPLRKDFPLAGLPAELPSTAVNAGRVETSPMAGGPFVPGTGVQGTTAREPRQYNTGSEQIIQITNPFKKESV